MTVQEYPPPLITAVAEAEDCFYKPQFLHLFNGGWLCQVLLCGDGVIMSQDSPGCLWSVFCTLGNAMAD